MFWKNSIKLDVVDSHRYYIDEIINGYKEDEWRYIGFYGEPETARRNEAWEKLRMLNQSKNKPWLCVGDFNKIIGQDENLGGALRIYNQMQLFREAINECSFMDLGFIGSKYTWSKHFDNGVSI